VSNSVEVSHLCKAYLVNGKSTLTKYVVVARSTSCQQRCRHTWLASSTQCAVLTACMADCTAQSTQRRHATPANDQYGSNCLPLPSDAALFQDGGEGGRRSFGWISRGHRRTSIWYLARRPLGSLLWNNVDGRRLDIKHDSTSRISPDDG
jgi:hypothetical protein